MKKGSKKKMFGKEKSSDLFNLSADLPTRKQQLQALNLLVILLPDANRDTLKVSRFIYVKYPSELRGVISHYLVKQSDVFMEVFLVKCLKERPTFKDKYGSF